MVMAGALGLLHLAAAPAVRGAVAVTLAEVAREQDRVAATAPACAGVMIIVAADDPTIAMFVPAALSLRGRAPQRLHILSMAAGDHRIERVTSRGFDVLVTNGLAGGRTVWERLFRAAPVRPGMRITTVDFEVTVIEAQAGAPVRTRLCLRNRSTRGTCASSSGGVGSWSNSGSRGPENASTCHRARTDQPVR